MRIIIFIFFITLLCPPVVEAERLSDLNMKAFDKSMEVDAAEDGDKLPSPFVPKSVAREDLVVEDLQLYGTAISGESSFALVNGNVIRIGDRIAGYRVKQIARDHLVLQKLEKRIILRLEGGL